MMFWRKRSGGDTEKLEARIRELEAENQGLREALAFYADSAHWEEGHKYRDADDITIFTDADGSSAEADGGVRARHVLRDD